MKKIFGLLVVTLLCVTSCTTFKQSASQRNVAAPIVAVSYADLDVSDQKITYTLRPTKKVRKGGLKNCINVAIAEALKANGGGDILVGLEVQTTSKSFLFWNKVASITVSGYPAKYVNFHSPDKSYWTPVGLWLTQDAIQKSKNARNSTQLKDILELVK